MLKIVEFIRKNKDWETILAAAPYNLKIKTWGDMVMFNYNQIESDPEEEIVKESRGLILERGTWEVIRYGFRRFMNLGERGCDELDWESIKATSKEDGTLIFLYYYEGWHIGTRSTFDAEDAELKAIGYHNFKELFDEVAAQYDDFEFAKLNPKYTYCLELCAPANRVVVEYKEPKLFHILTRNNETLEEIDIDIGIPKPKAYFLENEEEYKKLVESFDETHEGIVLQDQYNHRAKLKSLLYFELHRMVSNHQITVEFILDKIRTGEDGEFLCYFNEYQQIFNKIRNELTITRGIVENAIEQVNIWKKLNPYATRKDFSDFAKTKNPAVLWFKAYDGTAEKWFETLPTNKLISIFKIGEEV